MFVFLLYAKISLLDENSAQYGPHNAWILKPVFGRFL